MKCVFCDIIEKKTPSHIIWESDTHIAFLSIFPNTPGVTVVAPKKHLSSYAFDLSEEELHQLTSACKKVGLILDKAFDIGRTAMVFEGMGVNHMHAKLFPLHGTMPHQEWHPKPSDEHIRKTFFSSYPGYLSTHDGQEASKDELKEIAQKIKKISS